MERRKAYRNISAELFECHCFSRAGSLSSDFLLQFVMLLLGFLMEKELVLKFVSCLKIPSSWLLMSQVLK